MRAIDTDKIVGARIWLNEEDWRQFEVGIRHIRHPSNSWRYLEFKSIKDVNRLMKILRDAKKDAEAHMPKPANKEE